MVRVLVEQRRGELDLQRIILQQIDHRSGRRSANVPSNSAAAAAQFAAASPSRTRWARHISSAWERRGPRAARICSARSASCGCVARESCSSSSFSLRWLTLYAGSCAACFSNSPSRPHLGVGVRQEPRNLVLQRACADNLAQRSVGRQRQQIAREIESTGAQGALVGLLLHLLRLGRAVPQIAEHFLGEVPVFRETDGRASCGRASRAVSSAKSGT